jgi:hypothetical protein
VRTVAENDENLKVYSRSKSAELHQGGRKIIKIMKNNEKQ